MRGYLRFLSRVPPSSFFFPPFLLSSPLAAIGDRNVLAASPGTTTVSFLAQGTPLGDPAGGGFLQNGFFCLRKFFWDSGSGDPVFRCAERF